MGGLLLEFTRIFTSTLMTQRLHLIQKSSSSKIHTPYTYIPDPSLYDEGRVNKWGLIEPPVNEVDSLSRMMLNLTCGTGNSIKYEGRGLVGMPDQQFIKILIDRKLDYIVTEEVQAAKKFTYVIRIELCGCEKDVWRRIKVPSAIDLSKLQDQVICPVMGWGRGYHGYVFEDPKGMYYKCRGIKNKEPNPAVYEFTSSLKQRLIILFFA